MLIIVGSKNQAKIIAVEEIIKQYPELFKDLKVVGKEVASGVAEQPKSLEETIKGAIYRSKQAFKKDSGCEFSFGLESGITKIPYSKTDWMDFCACSIYDGKETYLGLSSFFEYPTALVEAVLKDPGMDITQAANLIGMTKNKNIGSAEGVIGILSKGRLNRKDYTKQAIITAIIRLENKEQY